MYALVGLCALIVFTYIRPQEFVPEMSSVPWINMWVALIVCGFVADMRAGRIRKEGTPLLRWAIAFYLWCLFTILVRQPEELGVHAAYITMSIGLSLVLQHAVQQMRAFLRVVVLVFVTSMFCTSAAFHQGLQDPQCILLVEQVEGLPPLTIPDGRECQRAVDCRREELSNEYACERPGVLGSMSVGGRVRFRGVLNDPNELTLAAGTSMPYAFAFYESKRTALRWLLAALTVLLVVVTDIFSQSRGAILVFLTVMGVYFVRKYGVRGLLLGAAAAAPLLLLGGRSGEEATTSSEERMEVMLDGLNMVLVSPIMGVGYGQFGKHTYLTAHNAYVLASAELGIVGFWIWTVILWSALRTTVVAYLRYAHVPGGELVRAWSLALFASLCGTLVGVFFLSWTYHYVLWIYIGIAGGFCSTIRTSDRGFDPRPPRRELVLLLLFDVAFLIVLRAYLKHKMG